MEQVLEIFGHGKDLTIFQMCSRGVLTFVIALILIRISGRRSFGVRSPLDNIIVLLLGAMLSRAIAGVSPFWPVIATCFVIVVLHRILAWLSLHNKTLVKLMEGEKILLFQDGKFNNDNMEKAIVCEKDIMQGVRKSASTEDLATIEKVYIEPNGEITAIKKSEKE